MTIGTRENNLAAENLHSKPGLVKSYLHSWMSFPVPMFQLSKQNMTSAQKQPLDIKIRKEN